VITSVFLIPIINIYGYSTKTIPDPEIIIRGINGEFFRMGMNISGLDYEKHEDYEIWKSDLIDIKIYSLGEIEEMELGGLEYEIILKRKMAINKLKIPFDYEGLVFYYQPEIPINDSLNSTAPENVIGSYAVYYDGKRDNEYKTGKLFHIYRPHLTDANNNSEWADIFIDVNNKVIKIDLPIQFLKKGKYPIIIDPTFGYTTIGAYQGQLIVLSQFMANFTVTINEEYGNLKRIYAYMCPNVINSTLCRAFIYNGISMTFLHDSNDLSVSGGFCWREFKGLNYNLTGGGTNNSYWIGVMTKDIPLMIKYDIVLSNRSFLQAIGSYVCMYQSTPNIWYTLIPSIYAEYDLPKISVVGGVDWLIGSLILIPAFIFLLIILIRKK